MLQIEGEDPGLPSIFRVGTLAAATIGAAALAAAHFARPPVPIGTGPRGLAGPPEAYLRSSATKS